MKHIPLDTTTSEGREVVKALIESKSPRLQAKGGFVREWFYLPFHDYQNTWTSWADTYLDGVHQGSYAFRLALPDSEITSIETYLESDEAKQRMKEECACGFDHEGWRDVGLKEPFEAGDDRLRAITRRHKADCPTLKALVTQSEAENPSGTAVLKPSREPFSLECDLIAREIKQSEDGMNLDNHSAYYFKRLNGQLRKIVERINSLEAGK